MRKRKSLRNSVAPTKSWESVEYSILWEYVVFLENGRPFHAGELAKIKVECEAAWDRKPWTRQ